MEPRQVIFRNSQAPGDVLMVTAAIRDLHRAYPGKFITGIEGSAPEVWENNPYISPLNRRHVPVIEVGYPMIHRSNQMQLHFLQGPIEDINKKLNLAVRLTEFRPDMHWTDTELNEPLIAGNYWVMISGGKADFTTKWWDPARYQRVIDMLQGEIQFVQLGHQPMGGGARHYHPPMANAINLVGKTNLREAFRIVLHSRGILTPVTCFMHLAAAIGKPAVVIAGGREHYTWEAYTGETFRRNMAFSCGMMKKPPGKKETWLAWSPEKDRAFVNHPFVEHKFLHTIGAISCCEHGGCWRLKVIEGKPEQNCLEVVRRPGSPPLPKCLDMITPEMVVNAIRAYESRSEESTMAVPEPIVVNMPNLSDPPPNQMPNPVLEAPPPVKVKQPKPVARYNGRTYLPPAALKFKHLTFPITVFGLTYGHHGELALRCLQSLYQFLDPSLFRLRYAFNAPTDEARSQVMAYLDDKSNVEFIYVADPQIYKYPMMRRMFHDPDRPIDTRWIMWFDDDSHVVDAEWIKLLGEFVDETHLDQNDSHPNGTHCFGKVYYWHFKDRQIRETHPEKQRGWVEEAPWYTGRDYPLDRSKKPPQAKSDFATGGWWLITHEAIQACNWPDTRIIHRGGDIMLGAALWQQGFGVAQVPGIRPPEGSGKKRQRWFDMVKVSDARQRGFNENIAGM